MQSMLAGLQPDLTFQARDDTCPRQPDPDFRQGRGRQPAIAAWRRVFLLGNIGMMHLK